MSQAEWTLFDELDARNPRSSELPHEFKTRKGTFRIQWRTIGHGPGAGVDVLTVSGEKAGFSIMPTRGMSLWKAWNGSVEYGWRSPVQGPVHPSRVPLFDPSGLGWLEGFDELLVRCGLESNGAPEFDEKGLLKWPLHGRVGNLSAQRCSVSIDEESGILSVTGVVRETRLFFAHLILTSTTRMQVDDHVLEVRDRVENGGAQEATHQMLYHLNFGKPVLDAGARLVIAADEVAPRNPHAASDIDRWHVYRGPQAGFAEQVYFFKPKIDEHGWSSAMTVSPNGQTGVGVDYDARTLPWFVQWKNTGADADGYVTGLEPSTNFPNIRSFEEKNNRVVRLTPGGSIEYALNVHLLADSAAVNQFESKVQRMGSKPRVHRDPLPDWSA